MRKIILLFFLIFSAELIYSQCNSEYVLNVIETIDNLTEKVVNEFLDQFQKDCNTNAEFSEFSNETLFTLLEKHPEILIKVLEKRKNIENYSLIINLIESPIHDGFDIQVIYDKVKGIKENSETKNLILEKLTIAQSKYGIKIITTHNNGS